MGPARGLVGKVMLSTMDLSPAVGDTDRAKAQIQ